jgi:RHS repeat-associated protein
MNVTALVDTDGDVVERYAYDAYGQVLVLDAYWSEDADNTSDWDNELLFAGYRFDPETGLYHVRNRMYHATLGRWVQRDPIGYVDGMNLHAAYFAARGLTDPLGTTVILPPPPPSMARAARAARDAVIGGAKGLELQGGSLYKQGTANYTYGAYALEVWMRGNGGFYGGNDRMREDLFMSEAIRAKVRELIEPEIYRDHANVECGGTGRLETTIAFGQTYGDPVELSGELETVARAPDSITCDIEVRYRKRGGESDKCCVYCTYVGLGQCRLEDKYDFHNPRKPNGEWRDEYKDKSWVKKEALQAAWQYQEATATPHLTVVVEFPVGVSGTICVEAPEWSI